MEQINYKLEHFEGPLDLLVTLIQKNKMNIEDIRISVLCDQYMEYIRMANEMDIELSSEFLVTASELMLIKSKMLLPRTDENEEDPRAALAAAVLEYQRAKAASAFLTQMFGEYGSRMIKDTDEISVDKTYVCDQDVMLLTEAMRRVLSEVRFTDEEARENFKPLLQRATVTVAAAAYRLIKRLRSGASVSLVGFFSKASSRGELVSMFLASLQLLKSGLLILDNIEETGEGVIDAACGVTVRLADGAEISALTDIIGEEE